MYIPNDYKKEDLSTVKDFLKANSFGILINKTNNKFWGTHIPLELSKDEDGSDILTAHLSKLNPQWKAFKNNEEVLAIFQGPHSYVSSSWYDHENVPTWNYIAVHVYGTIELMNEKELLQSLDDLVKKYEQNVKCPIKIADLSDKTMRQVNGIVGIKLKISEIQAAYKLSQNRNDNDYHNIISELKEMKDSGSNAIAKAMEKNRPN